MEKPLCRKCSRPGHDPTEQAGSLVTCDLSEGGLYVLLLGGLKPPTTVSGDRERAVLWAQVAPAPL